MKIIAHRGFSGRAPENTTAAFTAALEFQVDGLELDIHRSRDGELVICHEPTVDRTTNGKGYIKDLTWEELRRLDAGSWFGSCFQNERIPRLASLLELAGLMVNAWTVNEPFWIHRMVEAQIDAIITNFPDVVLDCLSEEKA
jgi:glycerophosphoryl diester phosphodiesterase